MTGEELKFRIFDDDVSIYSEGTIEFPVTDGTATGSAYLPFSAMTGTVLPTNVNAIQLWFGEDSPSIDAQIDIIGAMGPVTHDFELVPEPSACVLALIALSSLMVCRRR